MGIKGWFENKIAERKAKKAQQDALGKVAKSYDTHRFSNHDASKKGYKHHHGLGFVTRWIEKNSATGVKKTCYKHGSTFGRKLKPNNKRVQLSRCQKDPNYRQYLEFADML